MEEEYYIVEFAFLQNIYKIDPIEYNRDVYTSAEAAEKCVMNILAPFDNDEDYEIKLVRSDNDGLIVYILLTWGGNYGYKITVHKEVGPLMSVFFDFL